MEVAIDHLCRHAHLTEAVARLIHGAFWKDVKNGMTEADLVAHLRNTGDPARIPLSLVALAGDRLAGTVNLIDSDDRRRTHLHPWLAAMVVVEDLRGKGIGTKLVQALLAEARRLGFPAVYFGTDGPGFYARLGAVIPTTDGDGSTSTKGRRVGRGCHGRLRGASTSFGLVR